MANNEIRIGIWGGAGAGKTTFLSVLRQAAIHATPQWRVTATGANRQAAQTFMDDSDRFHQDNTFHGATVANATTFDLSFSTHQRVRRGTPSSFVVTIRDVPGGWFSQLSTTQTTELLHHFVDCHGILPHRRYVRFDRGCGM